MNMIRLDKAIRLKPATFLYVRHLASGNGHGHGDKRNELHNHHDDHGHGYQMYKKWFVVGGIGMATMYWLYRKYNSEKLDGLVPDSTIAKPVNGDVWKKTMRNIHVLFVDRMQPRHRARVPQAPPQQFQPPQDQPPQIQPPQIHVPLGQVEDDADYIRNPDQGQVPVDLDPPPDLRQYETAFVVGYTGESGMELVKELLRKKIFKKVILIGRKHVQLEGELLENTEQRTIDFEHIDQHKAAFADCSVGFCCLGTTLRGSKPTGIAKIGHDYVVNVAKAARDQGCQHFSVISSEYANKNSWFLFLKTKGQMEQDVTEIGFPRFSIFHPGVIVADRQQQHVGERIGGFVLKPIIWALQSITVPANTIAKAMVADLFHKSNNKVNIIGNKQIRELAKELK